MPGPLVPVPGVARVVIVGTAQGRNIVNVFHVANGPPVNPRYTSAGISALATGVKSAWTSQIFSILNNLYTLSTVTATDLTDETGLSAQATGGGSAIGGVGTSVPLSTSMCVTWRIGRHYRGGHPRTYLGPIPQASMGDNRTFNAGSLTTANTQVTGFLNQVNALVCDGLSQKLVCIHRRRHDADLNPVLVDLITSGSCDNRYDTQRRRLGPDV